MLLDAQESLGARGTGGTARVQVTDPEWPGLAQSAHLTTGHTCSTGAASPSSALGQALSGVALLPAPTEGLRPASSRAPTSVRGRAGEGDGWGPLRPEELLGTQSGFWILI